MPKVDGATIQQSIDAFDLSTTDTEPLSHAFKVCRTQQEFHRKTSEEFRILEAFKTKLLARIRSLRKGKSIEELDTEQEQLQKQYTPPNPAA